MIESPDIGEQFTVTVALANAQDVASYQATLQFDPEALRFVSWQQGTYFTEDVFVPPTLIEETDYPFRRLHRPRQLLPMAIYLRQHLK